MVIDYLFNTVWILIPTITLYLIFRNHISQYLKERNKILTIKNKNELYKLYSSLDPKLMGDEIDNFIKGYVEQYYLYNIAIRENHYINAEDTETMKMRVIESVTVNISELYLFYSKCLTNIENDEDLISFIKSRTESIIIDFVVSHNKPT